MKAPDEYGINKDFTEKSTDWIATAVKRCTDVTPPMYGTLTIHVNRDSKVFLK